MAERPEVTISALEHYSYCPRQCALIHVEQTYDENIYTLRGSLAHTRVHAENESVERGVRTLRGVALWSERHGLRGRADAVELVGDAPVPIEYKSGGHVSFHAKVQLCAQALCLEEMTGRSVPIGVVYAVATKRRHEVRFDADLRSATIAIVGAVRQMLDEQRVPPPVDDHRCPTCSLIHSCLPSAIAAGHRLRGLQGMLFKP